MHVLIKHWRKVRRLSQQDLAARVGISQSTLSRIENSHVPITLTLLNQCATALETSMEDLYSTANHDDNEGADDEQHRAAPPTHDQDINAYMKS